ncbi:hypothetical protein E4U13_004425 [Claviceps humidiphila]|uniref:Uncharacterized protein n=1 Tax=Claviceps humidiphila TaxID=1294629 RepID=A0A9P7TVS8_9HYPO|nr:hypothetical protein E4U13_004425 [Claviceps humidiphila]
MDKPNGTEATPQRKSGFTTSYVTGPGAEQQQHIPARRNYQHQLHEQIQRLYSSYDAPFYARLRGFTRMHTLDLAESGIRAVTNGANRALTDTETGALMEHFLVGVHASIGWKYIKTGIAGALAYRGRKTMRFPFRNIIVVGGKLDPSTGGIPVRVMWHAARFAAYYGLTVFIGTPLFHVVNFVRQSNAITQDRRLRPLLDEVRVKAVGNTENRGFSDGQQHQQQIQQQQQIQRQKQQQKHQQQEQEQEQQQQQVYSSQSDDNYQSSSQTIRAQTQQAWSSPGRQPEASREPEEPVPAMDWDAASDIDEASPVAPSAQSQSGSTYGSAWERLRQQQYQSPPTQERAPDFDDGWATDDEASPRYRGNSRTSAFSTTTDSEEAKARSKAQREFDEMLESDRRGGDAEQRSWGRR